MPCICVITDDETLSVSCRLSITFTMTLIICTYLFKKITSFHQESCSLIEHVICWFVVGCFLIMSKRVWKFSLLEFGFTFTILVIMNNIVKITTKVCHRYYVYSQRHRVSESCVDRKLQVISQELCNGRHGFQRREFQILRGKMA